MRRLLPSLKFVLRYALAIGTLALETAVLLPVRSNLSTPLVALLYLLPVGLGTALWGLGPGLMNALCAFLAFNYFFIEPYFTLSVHHTGDVLVLLVFFVVAVVISQLVGQAQAGLAAATVREREATQLYELSTALAGQHDDQAIAQVVGDQLVQAFQAEYLELAVVERPAAPAFTLHRPAESTAPARSPDVVVSLYTARGAQGELCLWRREPPIRAAEERLLHTFASQAALALERAALAQAEARAKVLEESDRLKSALLSSVSHELRTPLATIKAAATSLRTGEVEWESPARADLLAVMDDEADHLNRLVGNLLDMSRIESGALKPQRQWNLLAEIVGGVVARLRHALDHHRLEVDVPEDLPLVPVDYVQLEQVFTNLMSNSLKYAPAETTIRIRARLEGPEAVRVQVSNQGPPVPAEHLARIFDKFYRVTAADRVTGTGLGLSICKGIIEAHGGKIWAENLSQGFAFNFTLPLTWDGARPPQLPADTETL